MATKKATKRIPFGGYSINFSGCEETLEEVFGTKPIPPSVMTATIWKYVKSKQLAGKP